MGRLRSAQALLAATVVLTVASLAGCSGKDDGAVSSGSTAAEAGRAGSGAAGSAGPAPVTEIDPSKVIARRTFKLRAKPEDTVEFGVASLVVTGKIVTLQLVVTPRFKSVPDNDTVSLYDISERTTFRPYLMDLEHLKRYDVVRRSARHLSSDNNDTKSVNGTPMSAYAVFAAPEDGISAIDVHVADWWPAFKAVPIQR